MRQTSTTRVVIADRPGIGRSALATLVTETSGLSLVAKVSDIEEIEPAVEEFQPNVVVIDDRLLRGDRWNARDIDARVIVVGVDDDPAYVARARRLGAEAWVPKDRADELLAGLIVPAGELTSPAAPRTSPQLAGVAPESAG